MKTIKSLLLLALLSVISSQLMAQEMVASELPPSVEHQLFGSSIAISAEWALVGAPQKDINDKKSVGSVYLYQKVFNEGWNLVKEISPENLPSFSNFGTSVDIIDWNTIAISSMGSPDGGLFSEAVFMYEYDEDSEDWVHAQTLKPSDSKRGTRFGTELTFTSYPWGGESILAVGAYNADGNESKSGAVYIFEPSDSGWVETQKLSASEGESNDYFGHSLDFVFQDYDGDPRLIVGAYNATGAEERSGAVYVFDINEEGLFEESAKIFDPQGSSSDLFGYSVEHVEILYVVAKPNSLSGCNNQDLLFIGAPGANSDQGQTGTVYSACNNIQGWSIITEFSDPNSSENEYFGASLNTDQYNGTLFVGANRADNQEGDIYSYSFYDGIITAHDGSGNPIAPLQRSEGDYFGSHIASSGFGDILVSSPYKTVDGKENSGAVYFYNYPIVSDELEELGEVREYKLDQNYPNPFNPATTINYQVKDAGMVKLTVFNVLGQTVSVLVDEYQVNGAYKANFDASALSSGFYFYRLEINSFVSVKKMMLIK